MKKTIVPVVITAAVTSLATIWGFGKLSDKNLFYPGESKIPIHYASNTGITGTQPVDFSPAAEATVKSVVHVKTMTQGKTVLANDPFGFYGPQQYRMPDQMGAGSGVIISQDGYIITNNHVVQGADQVQVTFNDRNTQVAKVVGTDPATDIAVLKIDGDRLPYMELGNSDNVKLGQWVLAVGYPLNLDATVTAGIVSAKSRQIGLNQRRANASAIESYIQTDAAVNPGNSGGALVNVQGQLIGINAAIASPTGSYAGYSYAIPSNLAQKVASDIIKFGTVRRGYLGLQLQDLNKMDSKMAEHLGISSGDFKNATGVYVGGVEPQSGSAAAGIRKGDFITMVNGSVVSSVPQLQEMIARYHPGDKVSVSYMRDGKPGTVSVELKNMGGAAGATQGGMAFMGADLRNLSSAEAGQYGIKGGVMIAGVADDAPLKKANIQKGFVITSINDREINNTTDFQNAITQASGGIQLGGIYPGKRGMYYYGINDADGGY
ncbi:trypsin-like peptidase domain-containing protein [Taibaiella chishuiensis]|uniref:Do/DeqQ family serine protease n=1 Tax=Taibaiella chishuiensis TaxID=1434707 RepID=A0A2P8CYU0_9BACT|nr:trypsin-like peptidase domain-containing protein [Taibaiella chishuiensis]PSK90141.1 Do/DeqQ family serine protease [Taibaiella chishuiensis]